MEVNNFLLYFYRFGWCSKMLRNKTAIIQTWPSCFRSFFFNLAVKKCFWRWISRENVRYQFGPLALKQEQIKKKHRGKRTGVYFVDGFHLLCQASVLQMCWSAFSFYNSCLMRLKQSFPVEVRRQNAFWILYLKYRRLPVVIYFIYIFSFFTSISFTQDNSTRSCFYCARI